MGAWAFLILPVIWMAAHYWHHHHTPRTNGDHRDNFYFY